MKHTFAFLLAAWFSCAGSVAAQQSETGSGQTIRIDPDDLQPVGPLVQSVSFLKLEGINDESAKNQPRIKCDDSFLYIHGTASPRIYMFDKTGKLVRIIDHQGAGPGEYITITDYFVRENKLFIYDNVKGELLQYNTKGEYESKLALTKNGYRVAEYNRQYVVYMGNKRDVEYSLWVYDKQGALMNKYLKGMEAPEYYAVNSIQSPINPTDKGLAISYELNNTIYLYNNNAVRQGYVFDFGRYNLSERNSRSANMKNPKYMHRLMASPDQVLWINCFLNRGNLLVADLIKVVGTERICFIPDGKAYSFNRSGYPFTILELDMTVNAAGQFVSLVQTRMIPIMKKLQREGEKMNDYAKKLLALDANEKTDLVVCYFTLKQPD